MNFKEVLNCFLTVWFDPAVWERRWPLGWHQTALFPPGRPSWLLSGSQPASSWQSRKRLKREKKNNRTKGETSSCLDYYKTEVNRFLFQVISHELDFTSSIKTNTRASLSSISSWIFWNIFVTSLPLWNKEPRLVAGKRIRFQISFS